MHQLRLTETYYNPLILYASMPTESRKVQRASAPMILKLRDLVGQISQGLKFGFLAMTIFLISIIVIIASYTLVGTAASKAKKLNSYSLARTRTHNNL